MIGGLSRFEERVCWQAAEGGQGGQLGGGVAHGGGEVRAGGVVAGREPGDTEPRAQLSHNDPGQYGMDSMVLCSVAIRY